MQRQSLGSPGSKLHVNGLVLVKEDVHTNIPSSSTSDLSSQKPFSSIDDDDDGEEDKLQKKLHRPHDKKKFIHLIPVLTLFCILILYLSSHSPSQSELAGFNHLSKPRGGDVDVDSLNIDEVRTVLKIEKGEILAIRSTRNLQEVDKGIPKYRLNRKIGNF